MKLYWTPVKSEFHLVALPAAKLMTICSNGRSYVLKCLGCEFEVPQNYNLEMTKEAALEWLGLILLETQSAISELQTASAWTANNSLSVESPPRPMLGSGANPG